MVPGGWPVHLVTYDSTEDPGPLRGTVSRTLTRRGLRRVVPVHYTGPPRSLNYEVLLLDLVTLWFLDRLFEIVNMDVV